MNAPMPPSQGQGRVEPSYQQSTPPQQPGQREARIADQQQQAQRQSQPQPAQRQTPNQTERAQSTEGLSGSKLKGVNRARAREDRWQNNRLAVPYHIDGPKITFGIIWFAMLLGSAVLGVSTGDPKVGALGVAVVCAPIAGLAALQTTHAWFPTLSAPKLWTAIASYLMALTGFFAEPGVIIGFAAGVLLISLYVLLYRGHQRSPVQLFDVLARSALPTGVAVASIAALARVDVSALVSLILLVSAYEAGDFLIGTGSANAFEGPLAGLVALGVVAFLLFLTLPAPFTESTVLLFALLTAICCPLGQVAASGLLPRGAAWAPALRRLDSYLIAGPLWLVLVSQLTGSA